MAEYGNIWPYVVTAGESLDNAAAGTGHIHKAVRVDSGLIAANARTAIGILQSVGNNGEHVTLAIGGVSKYVAGAAVNPAAELTVATSGYMITAGSGDRVVGRNGRSSVASGAVGHGLFWNLANPQEFDAGSGYISTYEQYGFGAQADLTVANAVGKAVNAASGDFPGANAGTVVLLSGTVSGGTSIGRVSGFMDVKAGDVVDAGRGLAVANSGWFVHANSGDRVVGRALEASAAGNSGGAFAANINMAGTFAATSLGTI